MNHSYAFTWAFLLLIRSASLLAEPRVIPIVHPHDQVVHGWFVKDLIGQRLDRKGKWDVSTKLNKALMDLFKRGGGTLYLPAGKYRLDQPVFIPPGTALRGDFVLPGSQPVDPSRNTILCAYYGRGMDKQSTPLLLLDGSSLVDGLVIWYPEQKAQRVVPYAPTIRHGERNARWAINTSSRNILLVNAYTGIQLGKKGQGTCVQLMKHIYGTPLKDGIEVWSDADIPRISDINFAPHYWLTAGLGKEPVDEPKLKQHLFGQASGITYYRCDGSELAYVNIKGYHQGMALRNGHPHSSNGVWIDNEGHYLNFNITDCYYAVYILNIKNHGTQFYNCILEGKHSAVFIDNAVRRSECAMFMGCELRGGIAAVTQFWEEKPNDLFSFMFSACTFHSPVKWRGGNLSIVDCDFDFEGTHVELGPRLHHAVITDSRFKGSRHIINQAGSRVKIGDSREPYIQPPAYAYAVDKISSYAPPNLTSIFLSAGDGKVDDAARLQASIDQMSQKGGGYVVLSPGFYKLASPLIIRKNVELRGQLQAWQHSKFLSWYVTKDSVKGAVILVAYGKDEVDSAAIILEEHAGMDGLFFHYPEQEYDSVAKDVRSRYGWLVRLRGNGAYLKHITASNPWRFVDIHTHTPSNTYVGYCVGAPLEQGILVGEADSCMLDNVHFNSWYWNTVYFPNTIPFSKQYRYKKSLDNWMKAHTQAFVLAGTPNVDIYGSFIFCSKEAFVLKPGKSSGKGPSGLITNSGCDFTKFGLYIYANDGLSFLNTHLIDVAEFDPDTTISSIYVAKGCQDAISLYNLSTWGNSHQAISVWGKSEVQVDVFNFSYQLYHDQVNYIQDGKVRLVNGIRNIPRYPYRVRLGPGARLEMRANISMTELDVEPLPSNTNPQNKFSLSNPNVIRYYSFP